MEDKISKKKLIKYIEITEKALKIAGKNINERRKKEGEEIIKIASCYLQDAEYFKKQGDYVNAFACINYAHGWLDSGSRLGILKIRNSKLFVVQ